jgi:hypothetical protein
MHVQGNSKWKALDWEILAWALAQPDISPGDRAICERLSHKTSLTQRDASYLEQLNDRMKLARLERQPRRAHGDQKNATAFACRTAGNISSYRADR